VVVELDGTADQHTADRLTEFFKVVHESAVQTHEPAVVVDMRRLEFMNSSSFKALVNWVSNIQDLEPEQRYQIRVQSNVTIPWQKRSLQSLTYFAVDLVTVEYPASA
jgi:anti-anti-sigma factor